MKAEGVLARALDCLRALGPVRRLVQPARLRVTDRGANRILNTTAVEGNRLSANIPTAHRQPMIDAASAGRRQPKMDRTRQLAGGGQLRYKLLTSARNAFEGSPLECTQMIYRCLDGVAVEPPPDPRCCRNTRKNPQAINNV